MNDRDSRLRAIEALSAPALCLLGVAGLSLAFDLLGLFGIPLQLAGVAMDDDWIQGEILGILISIPFTLLVMAMRAFVFYGALQMRQGRNYGLCMAACIAACIPCFSPCCLVGIPFGVWGLVVLNRADVREGFEGLA